MIFKNRRPGKFLAGAQVFAWARTWIPAKRRAGMTAVFIHALTTCYASAANPLLPLDVQILNQDNFRAHNYMSVAEALRGETSIKIEQAGYRGTRALLKLRGLSKSEDVLVMLDGQPINHEFDGQVDLSQIPLEMVQRIEITRGGASSRYSAQAAAGAINIITFRPEQKGLYVDLAVGVGRHGAKNSDGRFLARSNLGDMTYIPTVHAAGGFSANEDYKATSHFGNFTRSFNGKGFWGAEYFYNESRVGLSNGTPVPFDQWNGIVEQRPESESRQRQETTEHVKAFVAWPLIAGGTTYATVKHGWRGSDDRAVPSGVSLLDKDSAATTADLEWRKDMLSVGYQARMLKRVIFANPDRETYENGLYVTNQLVSGKLSITPGLRYEHDSNTGGFVAPRLALAYDAGEWDFSSTVQRSHRIPSFDEFFSTTNAIRRNLDDEKVVSADVGAGWTPSDKATIRVTGFSTHVTDLVSPDAFANLRNQGKEKTYGLETEAHWNSRPASEQRWESRLTWTVQRGETLLDTTPGWVESAMTPHHLFKLILDKHMKRKMVWSNELRYQARQFQLADNQGTKLPDFAYWNTRFALRILAADMFVAIDNVTNVHYAETVGTSGLLSPQPTRTYWTGVSIRFKN